MTARASRPAWLAAAGGLALLCLAFRQEIGAAITVWDSSTAYGHCWLVLPIVGWLLWERRAILATGAARPTVWPAVAALPLAVMWVAADWLGIMEGRQLALVGFAELLLIACLGWRLWWALSAAFLYLAFLVPFGAFLTPALQRFTTGFILGGLRLLDIPFHADAFQIAIPEGAFYVAEACAGLRFLIASVAFGVLYAVTIFRSPWRRAAFIAVACVVPIVANGFRGLGIVLLGHALGSAQAGAADHLIYGWVFFSFVIVLLALSGLPFRQDMRPPAPPAARRCRPGHAPCSPPPLPCCCWPSPARSAWPCWTRPPTQPWPQSRQTSFCRQAAAPEPPCKPAPPPRKACCAAARRCRSPPRSCLPPPTRPASWLPHARPPRPRWTARRIAKPGARRRAHRGCC